VLKLQQLPEKLRRFKILGMELSEPLRPECGIARDKVYGVVW